MRRCRRARRRCCRTMCGGCAACWRPTAAAEIVTHGRGYELRIDPELVDVRRLERLVSEAGRNGGGAAHEALALFRGDPLADLADEPFAATEIRRLRGAAADGGGAGIDADLAAGRHQEVDRRDRGAAGREPAARAAARASGCWRSIGVGVRPRRWTPTGMRGARSSRRSGSSRGRSCGGCTRRSCARTPSLDVEPVGRRAAARARCHGAPPLIGRDGELRRLRVRWQRAATGAGALVTLIGGYGMGKTRIAAALAGDAHREGAAVLYATGTGAPEVALAAIAQVRDARRPTLLVLDDVDRAPAEVHAAVRELARALAPLPALVLATGQEAAALARLQPRDSRDARAARRRGRAADRRPVRSPPATATRCRSRRCSRRAAASRGACTRRRASGRGARRRAASTRRRAGRRPAAARSERSRRS